ncbi:hypothetical protein [Spirosoma montaniterrae]|uniref:hypothetical protein n=1 Tax=Spirosoma montaniterrae TaxID=1178516 RepID=UPI0012F9123D|nr:hypothetical protein [Spirosoma montaniterrae]
MADQLIKLLLLTSVCGLTACKRAEPVTTPAPAISSTLVNVTLDATMTYQTIVGFGGFGAQNVYWSNGPFTSDRFVNDIVTDLGCTIIRDEVPTSFEIDNDNADPAVTDLTRFNLTRRIAGHHVPFGDRVPHLKALREAGVQTFIASVWSPAPWMKWNNRIDNGTQQNSAPAYNRNPTSASNQLKIENYEEFAESCVAYCRIFKREIGVDLYGLSVQNEPRFSQSYQSCVYDGEALRDVLKVVGRRFKKEGLTTKLFMPEDVGWLDGVRSMTLPTLNDPEARQYVGMVATHGYALDGVQPASTDASTWRTMYGWGQPYNLPLWMTETSGFKNNHEGAMALAKAMYTAFRFGNVSAWVFWSLSEENASDYALLTSNGIKSKRYWVSKQFYRYVRPGAVRVEANSADADVLPLAFVKDGLPILVISNVGTTNKTIRVKGDGVSTQYKVFLTSATDNCNELTAVKAGESVTIPAQGVVTLVGAK